jgi:sigma-B regulation protein RsbU (phosphoserine phosphatase)
MTDARQQPQAAHATLERTLSGRVLIVDDELASRAYLRKLLMTRGCEVWEAADGKTARAIIHTNPPDLALVDVVMPGDTGYDVCQRMKADPACRDIPVIMVTAQTGVTDVEKGFDAGAFDYIRKPFHPRELVARVRNALELKRSNDALRLWKKKMSRELEIAGALQRKLFATTPLLLRNFEVYVAHRPSIAVGGDVFDAIPLPDGRLCVYIGDVAGHGVAPAIVASLLKAIINDAIQNFATEGPAAICRAVQTRFYRDVENPEMYATLFLGILSPQEGRWTCMNCGHPNPVLLAADQTDLSSHLSGKGDVPIGFPSPRGVACAAKWQVQATVQPGSRLLLCTDGPLESCQENTTERCGETRLATLGRQVLSDPQAINPADALFAALRQDGFPLHEDDCTVLAIEWVDPATIRLETQIPLDPVAVVAVAAQVDQLLRAEGWSLEAACAAQLVLVEHGTNIIQHGCPPAGSTIDLRLRLTGPICRMTLQDQGGEWNPHKRKTAAHHLRMDRKNEHTRGMGLIYTVSRAAEFFRRGHINIAFFAFSRDYCPSQEGRTES